MSRGVIWRNQVNIDRGFRKETNGGKGPMRDLLKTRPCRAPMCVARGQVVLGMWMDYVPLVGSPVVTHKEGVYCMTVPDMGKRCTIDVKGGEFYEVFPSGEGNPIEGSCRGDMMKLHGINRECVVMGIEHFDDIDGALRKYGVYRLLNVRRNGIETYHDRHLGSLGGCFVLMYYVY